MNGRGVTNYTTTKTSHGHTTSTTQFDDALMKHGIITFEQAMIAKGASPEEAVRLCQEKSKGQKEGDSTSSNNNNRQIIDKEEDGDASSDDDNDDSNDDNEFLKQYRSMRLDELQNNSKTKNNNYGQIIPITRTEWNHHVNESSQDGTWVLILLTSQSSSPNAYPLHSQICQLVENHIIPNLALHHPHIKVVSIPSKSAIPNFPEENLPTLFCYRFGVLQHQLIGLKELGYDDCYNDDDDNKEGIITLQGLEGRLLHLGVLSSVTSSASNSTSLSCSREDEEYQYGGGISNNTSSGVQYTDKIHHGRSRFQGKMVGMATGNDNFDDESDYDDVD